MLSRWNGRGVRQSLTERGRPPPRRSKFCKQSEQKTREVFLSQSFTNLVYRLRLRPLSSWLPFHSVKPLSPRGKARDFVFAVRQYHFAKQNITCRKANITAIAISLPEAISLCVAKYHLFRRPLRLLNKLPYKSIISTFRLITTKKKAVNPPKRDRFTAFYLAFSFGEGGKSSGFPQWFDGRRQ